MSSLAMPLIIINLGGEMSYILEQRLQAQNVIEDKSVKVLHEIIGSMMNKSFIKKLFFPQTLATRKSMRLLFEKIAHASIMRLNEASMDKLFDLMTMAVKYQMVMACNPYEVLNITLNHLDGIKTVMKESESINECVEYAYNLLRQAYFTLPEWKMALIRNSILSFFQDAKVKVSILMRENKQGREGDFITETNIQLPPRSNVPGTIRYYVNGECLNVTNFPLPSKYLPNTVTSDEYDMRLGPMITDRGTPLGTNMYIAMPEGIQVKGDNGDNYGPPAGDELKLLSSLLATPGDVKQTQQIMLSMFDDNDIETPAAGTAKKNGKSTTPTGKVKISKTSKTLDTALAEFSIDPGEKKGKGANLASLMEEAATPPKRKTSVKKRSDSAKSRSATPSRNGSAKKKVSK